MLLYSIGFIIVQAWINAYKGKKYQFPASCFSKGKGKISRKECELTWFSRLLDVYLIPNTWNISRLLYIFVTPVIDYLFIVNITIYCNSFKIKTGKISNLSTCISPCPTDNLSSGESPIGTDVFSRAFLTLYGLTGIPTSCVQIIHIRILGKCVQSTTN